MEVQKEMEKFRKQTSEVMAILDLAGKHDLAKMVGELYMGHVRLHMIEEGIKEINILIALNS